MTSLDKVRAAVTALKVFPLPSVVMLPGGGLSLHVFEPRYRELVKDALATDQVFAMATLEPGWEADYQGRPPIRPIVCAGVIAWHETQPDGRYNLALEAVARVRVLGELPAGKPYREVVGELLEDGVTVASEEALLRNAVLKLAGWLSPEVAEQLFQTVSGAAGGALADVVAGSLVSEVETRYQVLKELDPQRRLAKVVSEVSGLLGTLGSRKQPEGPLN